MRLLLLIFVSLLVGDVGRVLGVPMVLSWSDEFDCVPQRQAGPGIFSIDNATWDYEIGYIRNNEQQYYTNATDNVWIERADPTNATDANCKLVIQGLKKPYPYPGGNASITSGSIFTIPAFRYGRIDAALRVPTGHNGSWPAFWLLGADYVVDGWPLCGEIDVMENVGYWPNVTHGTIHDGRNNAWRGNDISNTLYINNMAERFVVYSVTWTPWALDFYADDVLYLTVPRPNPASNPPFSALDSCWVGSWPYDAATGFQIKLNLAIEGSWGGVYGVDPAMFPIRYEVDYVRVYETWPAPPEPPLCSATPLWLALGVSNSALSNASLAAVTASNSGSWSVALNAALTTAIQSAIVNVAADVTVETSDVVVYGSSLLSAARLLPADFSTPLGDGVLLVAATVNASSGYVQSVNWTRQFAAISAVVASALQAQPQPANQQQSWRVTGITAGTTKTTVRAHVEQVLQGTQPLPSENVTLSQVSALGALLQLPSYPATDSACVATHDQDAVCDFPASLFDFGGPNVAYYDTTPWNENQGGNPSQVLFQRSPPEWVDVGAGAIGVPDSGVIGHTVTGEWLRYSAAATFPTTAGMVGSIMPWEDATVMIDYASDGGADPASVIDVYASFVAVGFVRAGDASCTWGGSYFTPQNARVISTIPPYSNPAAEVWIGTVSLPSTGSLSSFADSTPLSFGDALAGAWNNATGALQQALNVSSTDSETGCVYASSVSLSLRFAFANGGANLRAFHIRTKLRGVPWQTLVLGILTIVVVGLAGGGLMLAKRARDKAKGGDADDYIQSLPPPAGPVLSTGPQKTVVSTKEGGGLSVVDSADMERVPMLVDRNASQVSSRSTT